MIAIRIAHRASLDCAPWSQFTVGSSTLSAQAV